MGIEKIFILSTLFVLSLTCKAIRNKHLSTYGKVGAMFYVAVCLGMLDRQGLLTGSIKLVAGILSLVINFTLIFSIKPDKKEQEQD